MNPPTDPMAQDEIAPLDNGGPRTILERLRGRGVVKPLSWPIVWPFDSHSFLISSATVAAALVAGIAVEKILHLPNILLIFLPPVLFSAVRYGFWVGLWSSLLSIACFCYFLAVPRFSFADPEFSLIFFQVAEPANIWALMFFILVAGFTSTLAARVRQQTQAVREQSRLNAQLYAFSRKLATTVGIDELLLATTSQIHKMLKLEAVVLVPENGELKIKLSWDPNDKLTDDDAFAARWCFTHQKPSGNDFRLWPGAKRYFLPLRTGQGIVGVLGVNRANGDLALTPPQIQLLDTLANQAAMTLERMQFAREIEHARVLAETDKLRAALLTSISHDLKTPLASILGNISSLRHFGDRYDEATRADMLSTAEREAERLNRFFGNLLDMTKLGAGALKPKIEAVDLSDVIGAALKRTEKLLALHVVSIDLPPDLPMVPLDFVLAEHVFVNLLDNAGKYAPAASRINIRAYVNAGILTVEVEDEGPGIPAADHERVFERFYRARNADRQRAGTGLGLAICRGFVEAMGGRIKAGNRDDRNGARITITLSLGAATPDIETQEIAAHGR